MKMRHTDDRLRNCQAETLDSDCVSGKSNRIDIQQQSGRRLFIRGFRIKNVCFPEAQIERLASIWPLVQQVADVSCGLVCCGNGE